MTAAPPPQLRPVGTRLSLRFYLGELTERHELIRALPRHDLHAQNMDTLLGNLWFLVNPILTTGVYFVIFGLLLEADRGVDNYLGYLIAGILVFRFYTAASTTAAKVMARNETLMRSLYFPRATIPLASGLGNFYTFLPGLSVMAVVVVATGETPDWHWLLLPVAILITLIFVLGTVLFFARLGHIMRDLGNLLPHLNRLLFYSSGALYDPDKFTDNQTVLTLFDLNPLYQFLSLARWCLMDYEINNWFWLTAPTWAVAVFAIGFLYFWAGESTYGSAR